MDTTLQQEIDRHKFVVDGILMDIEDDAVLDINEWDDAGSKSQIHRTTRSLLCDQRKTQKIGIKKPI